MKSNIKVKFNNNSLKNKISNSGLNLSCPKCQQKIKTNLNQTSLICPYCNTKVTLTGTSKVVDDITDSIKKVFK